MKIFAHVWYKDATTRDRLWTTIARQISDYTVVESVATTTTSSLFTCTVSEIFTLNNGVHLKSGLDITQAHLKTGKTVLRWIVK